ncbi:MAG: glycoside hydrolase family 2 TIM barrel-domain containing protein [Candidatus Solibacter sp.]
MIRKIRLLFFCATTLVGRTVDLSGIWDFRYDVDSRGEAAAWYSSDAGPAWTRIQVPGSFDQALRNNVAYQGKAWYRTAFEVAPGKGERVLLRFDGVAIRGKVWVNGTLAGEHLFPYTGFTLDVTGLVRAGANRLVVLADNQLLKDAIPDTSCTGWWNYGGINRGVWLETVPEVYATDLAATTKRNAAGEWELGIGATVRNAGAAGRGPVTAALAAVLSDAGGRTVWTGEWTEALAAGATKIKGGGAVRNVEAWSPQRPALYRLKLTVRAGGASFETTAPVGFRQIEVKGTKILLNGEPVVFKGVNYHEMYPGAGMTLTRERVRRDMLDMKAMGANFVRLAHYSHDRQAYELADELGLMVWSEIPAWQMRPETLGSDAVWNAYGAPQLREMIEQRRMHPSVVVWSVGNEFASDREPVAKYVARATAFVRELDPTRLVTFASDRRERDISFDSVDFIAINEYFGWYYGAIPDLAGNLDKVHEKWPGKPIVVSEFGSESIVGWKNAAPQDSGMDYSEDYHMKLVGTHLGYIFDPARSGYMSGALLWVYADFPNPSAFLRSPAHPPVAAYMNLKGLVTDDRRHKRVWAVVQRAFGK